MLLITGPLKIECLKKVTTTHKKRKEQFKMKIDIVRAWKDENYRQQLSSEEQATLPENPAGTLELSDAELGAVHGANGCHYVNSNALACVQSVLVYCFTINGNCGNAD
jgi:mersacidin/lichenicidin family type 2 lantibiotic